MADLVTLTAEDGHRLAAYRAVPSGEPQGGLVVVQEIFGVNAHIRNVCDGFAADGYVALAPALFDRVERDFATGYTPPDIERGRAVRSKLAIEDAVKDMKAAVRTLAGSGTKVGVVGYCFGGTLAWLAGTRIDGVAASVVYYGVIGGTAHEAPQCPVMLHFGETDPWIPRADWEMLSVHHPNLVLHTYPAGHGFNCDERPDYEAESAHLARGRTLAFFRQHVG